MYFADRKIITSQNEVIDFGDGLHIIYVNGEYRGDDKVGDLMHDFSCKNPNEIKSGVLRRTATYFKNGQEGVLNMCKAMEELNQMVIEHREEEIVLKLLEKNMPVDSIAYAAGLSEEKILELQKSLLVES